MTSSRRDLDRFSLAPATVVAADPAGALQRRSAVPPIGFRSAVQHALVRAVETVAAWHELAGQRRDLMALSDQMLRDIGITRAEAQRESTKPFWRV
jgi:uncharacterized protein YjiS (DUF1127 family)